MPEERISPGAIAIGVGLALIGLAAVGLAYALTRVPPTVYTCPFCDEPFDTYEDLLNHIESDHPGEAPPMVSFILGIKNYPEGSAEWDVYAEGGSSKERLYLFEKATITAPSVTTIKIRISDEEGLTLFNETVPGTFRDGYYYIFNCQTLQFQEEERPAYIIGVALPSQIRWNSQYSVAARVWLPTDWPRASTILIYNLRLVIPIEQRERIDLARWSVVTPEYVWWDLGEIPLDHSGEYNLTYSDVLELRRRWEVNPPVGVFPVYLACSAYTYASGDQEGRSGGYDIGVVWPSTKVGEIEIL